MSFAVLLADTREELFRKIRERDFAFPLTMDDCSQAKEIINGLLTVSSDKRYGYLQLCSHAFFRGMDFNAPYDNPSPPALNLKRSNSDEVCAARFHMSGTR